MSGKVGFIILLMLPLFGFGQVTEFMGRYRVNQVEYVDDTTWKLTGTFHDLTGSYTGLSCAVGDKIVQRDYDALGRMVYDKYKVVSIVSKTVTNIVVNVRSDYDTLLTSNLMPITGDFPIARSVNDTSVLTYRTSFYLNQIDLDYDAALDNLNLQEVNVRINEPESDPIYAADSADITYRIGLRRLMSNHDSLSKLDERSYESLTSKPTLTINSDLPYSAVITLDSSDVIMTADSGLSMALVGNEAVFKNTKRTLSSLDEKSYASLTNKPVIAASGIVTITGTYPNTMTITASPTIASVAGLQDSLNVKLYGTGTTNYIPKWTNSKKLGNSLMIDNGTAVGVGVNPIARFDVRGTKAYNIISYNNGTNANNYGLDCEAYGAGTNNTGGYFYAANATSNKGVVIDQVALGDNNYALYSSSAAKSYFQGKVGIATSSPGSTLSVAGNAAIGSNYAVEAAPSNGLIVEGNVGVGSVSPSETKLDVRGAMSYFPLYLKAVTAKFYGTNTAAIDYGGVIALGGETGNGVTPCPFAYLLGAKETMTAGSYAGYLSFWTTAGSGTGEANSGNYERMRITSTGKVGIGTTTPISKLHVVGSIRTSDSLIALGKIKAPYVTQSGAWDSLYVRETATGLLKTTVKPTTLYTAQDSAKSPWKYSGGYTILRSDRNVGVRVSSPDSALTVDGGIKGGNLLITGKATINGTIKIAGGTPGAGKVLTSDANGLASWATNTGAIYKGEVNGDDGKPAGSGTPLIDGTGTIGWYYACNDAGTYDYGNPSGNSITLAIGDQLYYNGTIWLKIPGAGSYTLPAATASALGGVKVGTSLQINSEVLDINDKDMGDITTSNDGSTWTLDNVNSSVGTYNTVVVNAKGQVTSASVTDYLDPADTVGRANRVWVIAQDSLAKQAIRTEYINHDSLVKSTLRTWIVNHDSVAKQTIRTEYVNHDSLVKSQLRTEYVNHDSLVKSTMRTWVVNHDSVLAQQLRTVIINHDTVLARASEVEFVNHDSLVKQSLRTEYIGHDTLVQQYARLRDALKVSKADSNINGSYTSKKYVDNKTWSWNVLTGVPGSYTPTTHTQDWTTILNPPATYTPTAHTQAISTITNLQVALDSAIQIKDSTGNAVGNYVTHKTLHDSTFWHNGVNGLTNTNFSGTYVLKYTSDFTSSVDGWAVCTNGTLSNNVDDGFMCAGSPRALGYDDASTSHCIKKDAVKTNGAYGKVVVKARQNGTTSTMYLKSYDGSTTYDSESFPAGSCVTMTFYGLLDDGLMLDMTTTNGITLNFHSIEVYELTGGDIIVTGTPKFPNVAASTTATQVLTWDATDGSVKHQSIPTGGSGVAAGTGITISGTYPSVQTITATGVPYTGATADVNLGTHTITTAQVVSDNFKITPEGGYAVKMVAGEDVELGDVVCMGSADNTVSKTTTETYWVPVGVVYANASSNSSVWVVVSGIATVKFFECDADRGEIAYVAYNGLSQPYCGTPQNKLFDPYSWNAPSIGTYIESKTTTENSLIKITVRPMPKIYGIP